ncbi:MAG: 1-deoxy-D-xylulose-5-phosphate reductoisomerase [Candidatus Melainabacteria bacterium RIFCSPHIGHO2_02_FULL_34_12]|nr:MAG: 1-deoxy-D-xylulose-5-phosphate reductoisomerase [Candidatus Melainabacteria bacterium RIFCSPHIGHO2_02_FULL_34_12]
MRRKKIAILGSTGSIGRQTLDVLSAFKDDFEVIGLAAGKNVQLLAEQIKEHNPRFVSLTDSSLAQELKSILKNPALEIFWGDMGLEFISSCSCDIVVNGLVGSLGLKPTISALSHGKRVAFANKETLVIAGNLIKDLIDRYHGEIIPLDSEHVAIHQCVNNAKKEDIKRIILTASGGPFRTWAKSQIQSATKEQALKHPTWVMGQKITIDSATLMNKGLEVIEAMHLFDISHKQTDVFIHPQSIMHSAVEFVDGNIIAQLGATDMKLPIQYSLYYPERKQLPFNLFCDLLSVGKLEFEKPDYERFPCLKLAYEVAEKGKSYPIVLNAANEIAVDMLLKEQISFDKIATIISDSLETHVACEPKSLEEIIQIDKDARNKATELKKRIKQVMA